MNSGKLFSFLLIHLLLFSKTILAGCGSCYFPQESGIKKNVPEGAISSGPLVNSPTASTLGENHTSVGFTFHHLNFNSIPAENAHELHHKGRDIHGKRHEEIYNFHVGHGITNDWDVYLAAPIVSKASAEIHGHRYLGSKEASRGFGDMRLVTKYRFWKKFFEAALIGGIKFPIGETSNKNTSGEKFETEEQPGSGSWDGEFGIAISRSFKKHLSLASSFQYALRGEGAQDRKLGDLFIYSAGTSYAFKELGKHPNLSLVLELNHKWALQDHSRQEDKVFDSGGVSIFTSLGLVADIAKNLSLFWTMPVPIYQNLGGEHEELNFEMVTGIDLHF